MTSERDDATVTKPLAPEEQRKILDGLKSILGPVLPDAISEIIRVADWELSPAAARPFVEFVHWINSKPNFIAGWRSDPQKEISEYGRFMKVTDDARSAYAAACYHLSRLTEMEISVNEVLGRYDLASQAPQNGVMAIGRMRQLDFEYHGFVLCCRRSLDYMAFGLATYFGSKEGSFRKFSEKIPRWGPSGVSKKMKGVCDRHLNNLAFVMDSDRGRSTRDKIAHYEFVQAAVINVRQDGHRFVGGGEGLRLRDPNDTCSLSEILTARAQNVHACLSDLLDTFRAAVIEHEATSRADTAETQP